MRLTGLILGFWVMLLTGIEANQNLPPEGKVLLFVGQDRQAIDDYSRELNTVPTGVMFYTSIQTLSGIKEEADHGGGIQDANHLLKEYPDSALQIGFYMVGGLLDVLYQKYDRHIAEFGEWMKESQRPIYLRIGYEFDLPQNEYDAQLYQKVFRYLVDHWRKQGVTNVAYVWHSYGVLNPQRPIMNWYPGDDYVDWFAVSFFNLYNKGDIRIIAKLAKEHHKPLMIAEASPTKAVPTDPTTRWQRWYKTMFDYVKNNDVRALSYINCDWESLPMWKGQDWGDSRVQVDPILKDLWLKEIGDPKYLSPSTHLFKDLGVIRSH